MTYELFALISVATGAWLLSAGDAVTPPRTRALLSLGLGLLAYAATGIARTLLGALS
jgi:hypothetical protein